MPRERILAISVSGINSKGLTELLEEKNNIICNTCNSNCWSVPTTFYILLGATEKSSNVDQIQELKRTIIHYFQSAKKIVFLLVTPSTRKNRAHFHACFNDTLENNFYAIKISSQLKRDQIHIQSTSENVCNGKISKPVNLAATKRP